MRISEIFYSVQGEGSLVGMGSVVVRDVEPHSIVVGVPAQRTGASGSLDT